MREFFFLVLFCVLPYMFLDANVAVSSEEIPISNEEAVVYRADTAMVPRILMPGPYLFLDEFLIASSYNIQRVVQVPKRDANIPNPIVTGKEDGCFQPYMTIVRDVDTKRFRIWYGHRSEDGSQSTLHIGYMESEDGIHWERPVRVLPDPGPIQFGVGVVDLGPTCADPSKRFTYAWWHGGGLRLATSFDGFAFTPVSNDPVILHNHDITGLFFDALRDRYVATVSVYRGSDAWTGKRRITMHSFSTDLLHWTQPHYVLVPDYTIDEGELQFYAMDGYLQRGGLTIGMVKVLRDDLKADDPPDPSEAYGVGYTTLAWSYDGETWIRDTEPFFSPNPEKGTWDHAHVWVDEQLPVGQEVYLYYGGYARGHKVNRFEERQIGLVKMKQDRYVARIASEQMGEMVTRLIKINAKSLFVNADAEGGSLRIEIRDEIGAPITGFTFADCSVVTSDAVSQQITWKQPLETLNGRTVSIAFQLKDASLFAFYLE